MSPFYISGRRAGLLVAAGVLIAMTGAMNVFGENGDSARETRSRPTDSDRAGTIYIKFADSSIPTIREEGRAPRGAYGVQEVRLVRPAASGEVRERAAALPPLPPPDPRLFELEWEDHSMFDAARLALRDHHCGWYSCYHNDCDSDHWRDRFREGNELRPTPADRHPRYNLTEYYAAVAEWRRENQRAAVRIRPEPPRRRAPAEELPPK